MTNTLTLVVMAAGMGSRYGGLKQLEGFGPGGETLLEYSLHDALNAGFTRAVFIIRKDIEVLFREKVIARFEHKVACECVFQELDKLPAGHTPPDGRQKPWGTGHAVLMAIAAVSGPFAVINADDFYGRQAFEQLAGFLKERTNDEARYALCGYRLRNTLSEHGTVSRGICAAHADGRLASVTEHTKIALEADRRIVSSRESGDELLTGEEFVSMNLWGFTPELFSSLQEQFEAFLQERGGELKSEFYLPFAVDADLQAGRASADLLPTESKWFGVTYPEDRERVQQAVQGMVTAGEYPASLWD